MVPKFTLFQKLAERDIESINKRISKSIQKGKGSKLLNTGIKVKKKIYYCYRFLSEFTGKTMRYNDDGEFSCSAFNTGSMFERMIDDLKERINNTKVTIDIFMNLLDDAVEYTNSKRNTTLQILMMIVTVLSLIVAIIGISKMDITIINSFLSVIKEKLISLFMFLNGIMRNT